MKIRDIRKGNLLGKEWKKKVNELRKHLNILERDKRGEMREEGEKGFIMLLRN